ncbi:TetR/AcrR family transcriptional regulator [Kitasatospora sp. NPDC093102]|uniref:TetR/AcrR family transcriptional regulator n=1 Tax=Kitasatospora sp. NPDC093102 TaxID=3155069 RepID=UPI003417991D
MPKISAATVAEHRAQQQAALIRAAVDVLVEQGAAAVTPASVGARAGLARSSVYQYFPSGAAILASVVESSFADANRAVDHALQGLDAPVERIVAYIETELRLAEQGAHRPASALMRADLPAECQDRVRELHHQHAAPLLAAIADSGAQDPLLTAQLVGGLLQAAVSAVDGGGDRMATTERVLSLIREGLIPGAARI